MSKLLTEISVDQIHSWDPCNRAPGEVYSRENLRKMFDGETITPLGVCDLDIPPEDRAWVLLRPEIISKKDLRLLAADFAEHILPIFEAKHPDDDRVRNLIAGVRQFAHGKITRKQLNELRAAAGAAAAYAPAVAGAAAAYAAAYAAAAAAAYAARAKEYEWQVEQVRVYFED